MATTNRFQTRVLIPSTLKENELRFDSILNQVQSVYQTLNQLELFEEKSNRSRIEQIEEWKEKMMENLDQMYEQCSMDFQSSLEQLKAFQKLMENLLNYEDENHLDGKKLAVIEQEICILKCLTYQLDVNKVKIDGKLKLKRISSKQESEIIIDDQFDQKNPIKFNEDFISRILVHRDSVEIIENLNLFQQFGQVTNKDVNSTTPERVLTITGKDFVLFGFDGDLGFRSETFGCD